MRKYHPLTVVAMRPASKDSMRIALDVPDELREEFAFLAGQHLPVQIELDGKKIRRTYSICSPPGEFPLEVGVRIQPGGLFSGYVAGELQVGDHLEAMPPFGRFHATPDATASKTCLAFAGGSGITPIISIIRATLEQEPASRFLLFYGNRRQDTTMFIDDLYALKNCFPERLQLFFLFSREEQEFPLFGGRLDEPKTGELYELFCAALKPDEAFVCGPDTMLDSVRATLLSCGMARDAIHVERYGAPRKVHKIEQPAADVDHESTITVIMDGHRKSFPMSAGDRNIVDAAAEQGIELPFSCKGGVCATCRTHVQQGEVLMATNYGLEPWEVEDGFVLACQSRPVSGEVVLDYDKT